MNNDLISRSVLLKDGIRAKYGVNDDGLILIPMGDVRKSIKEAPAVDAVEVVRCEKCRYCFDGVCLHPENRIAMKVPDFGEHYSYMADLIVPKDHFCGYGKWREDHETD